MNDTNYDELANYFKRNDKKAEIQLMKARKSQISYTEKIYKQKLAKYNLYPRVNKVLATQGE